MFPEAVGVKFGLFSLIDTIGKWRKQASLPKGQTLQMMTTPEQWARLVALRNQGFIKPGFERKHPYHLAMTLTALVRSKSERVPGADSYVRRYVRKNPAKEVPLIRFSVTEVANAFFASSPLSHVPCLMDAVTLVEAGQAGIKARADAFVTRSQAWAARRVPEALMARSDNGQRSCWPEGTTYSQARQASLRPIVRDFMDRPEVTLAVLSLESLAQKGGVLDDLVTAGFDISGPNWRN